MAIDGREMIRTMDEPSIRHRNTLKRHYTMTSNVILFGYKDLTDSEKLTYQAIDSFDWSDEEGKRKGFSFPSARTLAHLRGVDRRTIFRHFDALERVGLLKREQRSGRPTLLWIEEPSAEESQRYLSTIALGRDTDVTPTRDTDVTALNEESEESEEDKTVNGAKASKGRRGEKRFLSAEERAKRDWLVGEILDVCRDEHSLAYYRRVAVALPPHRVFQALSEVRLAARENRITRSPAALFTAILRTTHEGRSRDRSDALG